MQILLEALDDVRKNVKVFVACQEQPHGKPAFENLVSAFTQILLIDKCKINEN